MKNGLGREVERVETHTHPRTHSGALNGAKCVGLSTSLPIYIYLLYKFFNSITYVVSKGRGLFLYPASTSLPIPLPRVTPCCQGRIMNSPVQEL